MDREATERNLQEMRDFSKQQKISYAKMAREQENREKRLEDKERALELKRREAEDLLEEAKHVADRRGYEAKTIRTSTTMPQLQRRQGDGGIRPRETEATRAVGRK